MGAPAAVLEQARAAAARRQDCPILPCNVDAVRVFYALSTQWRTVSGMAGAALVGLDYTAVPTVLRLLNLPRKTWPAVFDALRVMEAAALEVQRTR